MAKEKKGQDAQIVFKETVPYSVANKHVKDHRRKNPDPKQGVGVYYTPDDILKYVNEIFPALTAAQDKWIAEWLQNNPDSDFDPSKHEWKIGFFWMEKEGKHDKKKRPDFYVVPVLVSKTNPNEVTDYYNLEKYPFLDRREEDEGSGPKKDTGIQNFSYNTGNMFP